MILGSVKHFIKSEANWNQISPTIYGDGVFDKITRVSLSKDGRVLAVAYESKVNIYKYDDSNNYLSLQTIIHNDICDVDVNEDGKRIIIGHGCSSSINPGAVSAYHSENLRSWSNVVMNTSSCGKYAEQVLR